MKKVIFQVLLCVVVFGCEKSKDELKNKNDAQTTVSKESTIKGNIESSPTDDSTRLVKIQDRIRASGLNPEGVVFGQTSTDIGFVSIDFGAFSRLNDDGVAAMIIHAVVKKDWEAKNPASSLTNQFQKRQQVLFIDEEAGFYMARAGFQLDGFREWMEDQSLYSSSINEMSSVVRIDAFKKGYSGESRKN